MYCSNCAKAIPDALNYCSSCGAPTSRVIPLSDSHLPRYFVTGATFIAIIGLGALFPLLRMLLDSPRIDPAALGMILLMYLSAVFLMFSVMITMAWKFASPQTGKKRREKQPDGYQPPASLRGVSTSQLHPGDPSFGSVTDSTTRTLDEVLVERK